MSRVVIGVTPEQHQRLQAMAALSGQTIKDYILARALPPMPETESLAPRHAIDGGAAFRARALAASGVISSMTR
jgi:hypothetical protein